jgi:hypothetical protein
MPLDLSRRSVDDARNITIQVTWAGGSAMRGDTGRTLARAIG